MGRHTLDFPVNKPHGAAGLQYSDTPRPRHGQGGQFSSGGVIAGRFTARHAQLCPSAYGRVKRIDELTPNDLLRLALDGSRETLRDAVIVAVRPCS
jgi:hypothetical protein